MSLKFRIASSALSENFIIHLKHEIPAISSRAKCFGPGNLRRISRLKKQTDLKINVGGGPRPVDGWTTIDLFPPKNGIRWDVRWGLPLSEASVAAIHCEHFLEHLSYPNEALALLREFSRVLGPTGDLRLIVPDAEKYIRAYADKNGAFWNELKDLGGANPPFKTEVEIINQSFRMGSQHHYAYDRKTLFPLFEQAGFELVATPAAQEFIDLPDTWRRTESLYLHLRKSAKAAQTKVA